MFDFADKDKVGFLFPICLFVCLKKKKCGLGQEDWVGGVPDNDQPSTPSKTTHPSQGNQCLNMFFQT